ncbi:PREDICTED: C-type lectin domain family 5 member A [Elephantulus edwardii]|uniref:C-type lectin domain family 5 member A n=1 Tax=Elephantulus edwardii TaxID=28737 RepID=UPI0003F0E170|nr:PREDICTED: C-type lectin domain family 5 member A [Elephantulus edwardii]
MNWHMIVSGLIVVILKVVGMTFFLLYFPQIFSKINPGFAPTESYGTVPQSFGTSTSGFVPTGSYTLDCPTGWVPHQGRCFLLATTEMSWQESKDYCKAQESTLAVVNTPEKLKFLQNITSAEKYFIGLTYQPTENRWKWINNSPFEGNVINHIENFNCATIGLTQTFDSALCETSYRWICEKKAT